MAKKCPKRVRIGNSEWATCNLPCLETKPIVGPNKGKRIWTCQAGHHTVK